MSDTVSLDALTTKLIQAYETITHDTVRPGSRVRLFISWLATILLQERVLADHIGRQNIPSQATGANLDKLGEAYCNITRPEAQPALCTQRFEISEAQRTSILVPKGTRVTDAATTLVWETLEDVYIPIGSTYVDTRVRCQTPGTAGNGYAPGQICDVVDLYDYYSRTHNITTSGDGADRADDDTYRRLMRDNMDTLSGAGSRGGYAAVAKRVNTGIADVLANQSAPGTVSIYVLMDDGQLAGEEIKKEVAAACNADTARPLADKVMVADAEQVSYNVELTYYIQRGRHSAAEVEQAVSAAVAEYNRWQAGRFGRDILPDKLRELLYRAGVKRVDITSPTFQTLRNGKDDTVPQVGKVGTVNVTNGGYEDE